MKHKSIRSALISVSLLIVLIAVAVFHTRLIKHPPEIHRLSPAATYAEEPLVIEGSNFGSERAGAEVVIAGIRVTSSHYIEWSDSRIRLLVPHGVKSGRVIVKTSHGTSNGALFTNKSHIPVILSGPEKPGNPYIEDISPEKGAVGTEVVIRGANFGGRRSNGRVYFRFLLADTADASEDKEVLENVACSETDGDYLLWSDQEVRVFVPDGAVSGSVTVRNDRGGSNAVYFEVASPSGTKRFERKKGYQIQHEIRIASLRDGQNGEGIELWVPRLYEGYTQQSVEEKHEPGPMWKNYRGVMRYHLTAEEYGSDVQISHTYWFDRYSISTDIVPESLPGRYNRERTLFKSYTAADVGIPSDEEFFRNLARRIGGRSAGPYHQAESVYRFLLDELEVNSEAPSSLKEAVEAGSCRAEDYGMLFVTLARALGIPARPSAGFIVYGDKKSRNHVWAEFYLPHYGWVPVDPALGDGIGYISMPVEEPESFYFGNMDNQHITFSRHIVEIPKSNPHSVGRSISSPFSLQSFWEEYQRTNEGYRSSWGDLRVIDWW